MILEIGEIALGSKVKDKITGLEGTVVARTKHLYGCVRVIVQPHDVKDGKPAEWVAFDEPQMIVLEDANELVDVAKERELAPTHGPYPDVSRPSR